MEWAQELGMQKERLCEGVGEDAPILPPSALLPGKSSSGIFLSPTEVFPGLWLSHLPWRRLMVGRRRGTHRQSCLLFSSHPPHSCLLAQWTQNWHTISERLQTLFWIASLSNTCSIFPLNRKSEGEQKVLRSGLNHLKSKTRQANKKQGKNGAEQQQRVPQLTCHSSHLTSCRLSWLVSNMWLEEAGYLFQNKQGPQILWTAKGTEHSLH